jgi:putative mRNA 3-end processing factor
LKVTFLGGTESVGRSAVLVESENTKVILDYGVALNHIPGFPAHIPPREIDGIILTHAHLDHTGAAPYFYVSKRIPLYLSTLTLEYTDLLLRDFLRLSGYYLPYETIEVDNMISSARIMEPGIEFEIGDFNVKFLNSGHIPGSIQVILEDSNGSRLLYTGDINDRDTRLLNGADLNYGRLDAAIMEATYAGEEHPDRSELEKEFVAEIYDVLDNNGKVLIPAFSVGRAHEIICILSVYNIDYPVYVDGMAVKAGEILLKHSSKLKDGGLFKRAWGMVDWPTGWKERKNILKKPCIIVSPAGMLKGGIAVFYMEKLMGKPENGVFLVSYQIPGTPGDILLKTGKFMVRGKAKQVKARVKHFDFSSHAGHSGLVKIIEKIGMDAQIFLMHGEPAKMIKLQSLAEERGYKCSRVELLKTYEIG